MGVYICFPEGKTKALTMSYDDGQSQDERLVSIFNKYGIKGTFNLTSSWLIRDYGQENVKNRLDDLYAGHEIATHSYSHPTLERCPLTLVASEIIEDRKFLESICEHPIRGHAYPNGSYTSDIKQLLSELGIAYARVVPSTHELDMPKDYYEWQPTCHHSDAELMNIAKEFADFSKKQYLKLMYVWGHSYEFDRDNNWEVIEEFCEYIGGKEDIWYATNIQIVDYMKATNSLQFSADHSFVFNPSAINVFLQMDDKYIEAVSGTVTYLK